MVFVLLPLHFSSPALSSFLSSFSFWSVIFEQPKTCQVFPLSPARLSLCTKLNCRLSAHLICISLIKESYIVLSLAFSKPSEVTGYSKIIPSIKCGFEKLLERCPPLSVKKTEWQKKGSEGPTKKWWLFMCDSFYTNSVQSMTSARQLFWIVFMHDRSFRRCGTVEEKSHSFRGFAWQHVRRKRWRTLGQ